MKVFNVPDEIDEWLTLQFIIFFVIGFLFNVYANGNATLVFFDDYYNIDPYSDISYNRSLTEQEYYIREYASNTLVSTQRSFWIVHFLYWILSPLINFYYGFFRFKNLWT